MSEAICTIPNCGKQAPADHPFCAAHRHAAVAELVEAAGAYMSAFGQALDAHDIAYGPQQEEADKRLRELLSRHQAGMKDKDHG